jgi:hypothetical protein
VTESPDDRAPMAIAYHWASRIVAVALEMVLPGLAGYWLDQRLGTLVVFTFAGFAAGLFLGMKHLLQMVRSDPSDRVGEKK